MRVIALSTLKRFWDDRKHADAREPLLAWYRHALKADWRAPADVKQEFGTASILRDGRAVFNIGGNKVRLIAAIHYNRRTIYIRAVLTHHEYDEGKWKE